MKTEGSNIKRLNFQNPKFKEFKFSKCKIDGYGGGGRKL